MWRQGGRAVRHAAWAGTFRRGGDFLISCVLLVAGLAVGGGSPTYVTADDSAIPAPVRAGLFEDAARLAAREAMADPNARRSPLLPVGRIANYYDALVRVYNFDHSARDSVVTLYDVHTDPNPTLHRVHVAVARDRDWTAAWSRGMTLTGNPEIDEIIHAYDLELEFFARSPADQRAVLFAPTALNMLAVAERFSAVAGVESAEPFPIHGDGDDIRASASPSGLVLEYSTGLGECRPHCAVRRSWRFVVDDAGRVSYLGAELAVSRL